MKERLIRVRAPSRLHFGFLNFGSEAWWPNQAGQAVLPARHFGSVGLTLDKPGLHLLMRPAPAWSAEGPLAERALAFVQQLASILPAEASHPHLVSVDQIPPEHVGLGTGTQLALAVAQALLASANGLAVSIEDAARLLGRGVRSAIGIYAFIHGGFLVDGGQGQRTGAAPLLVRVPFPESWPILLIIPRSTPGRYGLGEKLAFEELRQRPLPGGLTESLARLVLLGMLPALAERDILAFGEAVYDFNLRVGEVFAPVQGGPYSCARAAKIISFMRHQGIRGVGQSSWGSTLFAIMEDVDQAEAIGQLARARFSLDPHEILVTGARNHGALTEYSFAGE